MPRIDKLEELLALFNMTAAVPRLQEQGIEPQHYAPHIGRNYFEDRIFPLETVEIQGFKTRHEEDIEQAIVHIGPYADEFARSMSALAVTVGTDMYFRSGAYRPEEEEGRQTIAHELTHVAQYEEGRLNDNADRKELEQNAKASEARERYEPDAEMTIKLNGNYYTFPRSKMREYAGRVAAGLKKWVYEQKYRLSEEAYLRLLCSYSKWLK
ncbi:MAG: DUF4157 domain-containing protein [Treponema sp.]|jgi:hypothetical protein|nr:DUF4157 domain-containing protein [Treponema sp.]